CQSIAAATRCIRSSAARVAAQSATNRPTRFLFLLCLRDLLGSDTWPRQPWKRAGSSGSHRAFRGLLARVLLQASEECAQRSRARRSLARRARGACGQFKARVDLGEAPVRPDVLAPADDTIGECDVPLAAGKLAHLEARRTFALHVKPAAVALGSEEHAIVAALDHFGEVGIELDHRAPSLELRGAEILEPQLRALHAIEILTHDTSGQRPPFFHRSVGRSPCKTLTCACSSRYVARRTATCSDRPFLGRFHYPRLPREEKRCRRKCSRSSQRRLRSRSATPPVRSCARNIPTAGAPASTWSCSR